jgi:hypothetical protein
VTNPLLELEKAIAHLRLNPQPEDARLEELRQQYETVLTLLESEFLGALMSGDWAEFDQFVSGFKVCSPQTMTTEAVEHDTAGASEALTFINRLLGNEASTEDLSRPGAGSFSQPTN